VPVGDAARFELAAEKPPLIVSTVVHPHTSPFQSVTIAAVDLTRVRLRWAIGAGDHGADRLEDTVTPGLVPNEVQSELLALFNGGFQARHGYWGVVFEGKELLKPQDHACTVVVEQDGTMRLGTFTNVGDVSGAHAVRQTPPCILENGEPHALLKSHQHRLWAGHNPDRRTRRRSAIGLDASGQVLFYAVGVEVDPLRLAEGLRFAGAVVAAQLDINWNWTRFLLVGRREAEGPLRLTSSLVEVNYGSRGYLELADQRDFFYLLRRKPGTK
jgi:hypothetical protein